METVKVNLGPKSYSIAINAGLVDQVGPRLRALLPQSELAVVITDSNVGPLYGERLAQPAPGRFPNGDADLRSGGAE